MSLNSHCTDRSHSDASNAPLNGTEEAPEQRQRQGRSSSSHDTRMTCALKGMCGRAISDGRSSALEDLPCWVAVKSVNRDVWRMFPGGSGSGELGRGGEESAG